jgi:hypothetical protein
MVIMLKLIILITAIFSSMAIAESYDYNEKLICQGVVRYYLPRNIPANDKQEIEDYDICQRNVEYINSYYSQYPERAFFLLTRDHAKSEDLNIINAAARSCHSACQSQELEASFKASSCRAAYKSNLFLKMAKKSARDHKYRTHILAELKKRVDSSSDDEERDINRERLIYSAHRTIEQDSGPDGNNEELRIFGAAIAPDRLPSMGNLSSIR